MAFATRQSDSTLVVRGVMATAFCTPAPADSTTLLRAKPDITIGDITQLLFEQSAQVLVVAAEGKKVCLQQEAPLIVQNEQSHQFTILAGQRGQQGEQGIPGPAGGTALSRVAGETLSALRVVYEIDGEVFLLDSADDVHIDQLLGLTITSGNASENVNVQLVGAVDDASWSWTPGRVYLGANGFLTQTPPDAGYLVLVGYAVSATRLILNIQDNIEL